MTALATPARTTTKMYRGMPPMMVPDSVKFGKSWGKNSVDAIVGMSNSSGDNGRSPRQNKQINYDIVNSRFKQSDFNPVLNPYGIKNPAFRNKHKMQNYNIIRPKLETLKGEEMKMGLNFRAAATNGEAVNERREKRNAEIQKAMTARIEAIAQGNIDPETGQPNAPDPAEVAREFDKRAIPTEIVTNRLLKYIIQEDELKMKFSKGWEHCLVSAEEIYFLSVVGGKPSVRVCNPLNVSFDREVESPFVHDADWVMEERWIPVGRVIDVYGEHLSDRQVRKLDNGEMGGKGVFNQGMFPGFAYGQDSGTSMYSGMATNTSHVYVANCVWRAYVKLGLHSFVSERTGKVETREVDDSFVLTPEQKANGDTIDWRWETEIWQGTKIGNDEYVDIRPVENQTGNLPYVGYIYNNVNSIATSIVDMCKAHQYTYIVTWYRLEQELARAKGKKFVMDLAQLPKSRGWTTSQWMHYFEDQGVAWINSTEEGRKGDATTVSKFNQFQSIDMSLSQVVGQYMEVLAKLEEQVTTITGVSRQREGDIASNETATGANRSIIQSTNNTKPLFYYHDLTRKTVLNEITEMFKIAYADGADITYALNEKDTETIKFDQGFLNGTDLGVFLVDSFEENESIGKLESMLEVALQQDKIRLSDAITVIGSKSMSEIRAAIVKGEEAKAASDSEAAKANSEAVNNEIASKEKLEQDKLAAKKYDTDMKYKTAIDVKTMEIENSAEEVPDAIDPMAERKLAQDDNHKQTDNEIKKAALEETKRANKAKEQIARSKPAPTKSK